MIKNDPRMALTPTTSGIADATMVPNTKARSTKVRGMAIDSAIAKSFLLQTRISNVYSSQSAEAVQKNVTELFQFSLELKEPETRLSSVKILIQSNNLDLALKLSEQTAKEFPKSYAAWDQVARIYEGTSRKELAVKSRKMTVRLDPLNKDIQKLLLDDLRK